MNDIDAFFLSLRLYSATCGYDKDAIPGGRIVKTAGEVRSVAVNSAFSWLCGRRFLAPASAILGPRLVSGACSRESI
ncbi:hypothetical protein BGW80DRAFT_1273715 [Lactifluus volemus]|nr:hypothetical protein BGW80DRAFT_1377962 [Lactifluus volemus]KAH9980149.1 hypothetical protein BGW80DRAFT_1273715 [Lactifluus volemus]